MVSILDKRLAVRNCRLEFQPKVILVFLSPPQSYVIKGEKDFCPDRIGTFIRKIY